MRFRSCEYRCGIGHDESKRQFQKSFTRFPSVVGILKISPNFIIQLDNIICYIIFFYTVFSYYIPTFKSVYFYSWWLKYTDVTVMIIINLYSFGGSVHDNRIPGTRKVIIKGGRKCWFRCTNRSESRPHTYHKINTIS